MENRPGHNHSPLTIVLAVGAVACGVWTVWLLSPTTTLGADFNAYQAGSSSFFDFGDPYLANATRFFETHYRYPPLLAMVWPVLEPIWYPLLTAAWCFVFGVRLRVGGWTGLLLPIAIAGLWIQALLTGNAGALVIAALCIVPIHQRAGAIAAAGAAWLKLYPALVIIWYVARRDWVALKWFALTFGALGLVQALWLDEFVRYATSDLAAVPAGFSFRASGTAAWVFAICVLTVGTVYYAKDRRRSWGLMVFTMLASIPRLIVPTFAVLLADPWLVSSRGEETRGGEDSDAEGRRLPRGVNHDDGVSAGAGG